MKIENTSTPGEWILLHNPASRMGRRSLERVRSMLRQRSLPRGVELRPLPLQDIETMTAAPSRLIALGGDGTVNAAAGRLLELNADAPLAILPAGTGNNLARGLGLPLDLGEALALALDGAGWRAIDGILYSAGPEGGNGGGRDGRARLLVQSGALGFPARIAGRYDSLRRSAILRRILAPAGPHVYRLLALGGLIAQKWNERRGLGILEVECRLPGENLRETVFAVFFGNDSSLGGNFHPCPRAKVDDGSLDICLVRAGTGASYLKLFRAVIHGDHLAFEKTVVYRQTRGPLEIVMPAASPLLVDGDLWVSGSSYRFDVLPARFRVIAAMLESPSDGRRTDRPA